MGLEVLEGYGRERFDVDAQGAAVAEETEHAVTGMGEVEDRTIGEKGFIFCRIMEPIEIGGLTGVLQGDAEQEFAEQAGMLVLP